MSAIAMNTTTACGPKSKPRLLFFQNRYDERLPPFLLTHVHEHVRCLREFFEVTVIHDDCDYEEVCARHQPDLVLVESGVNHLSCRRPHVINVRRNSRIPKVGLHHADAFCNVRAGFLSDMDYWDIDTFFAISTTAGEHTSEAADRFFYWPVFIDPNVFRDYGLPKSLPVLMTGNSSSLYPWRREVFALLSSRYPTLVCPHPGYDPSGSFGQVLFGEDYARALNTAACVPSCGTVAKELVRKHLEIPGCNACLITEESAALQAAGFQDMVNCVFAGPDNVIDKVEWLFRNPDALAAITRAGHALVHSRHTYRSRGQLLEWYRLRTTLPDTQRIIQPNPFDLPIAIEKAAPRFTRHVHSEGRHLQLLREGDSLLAQKDFEGAERAYLACIGLMPWMPEPRLRMAICSLYRGDATAALRWLDEITGFVLREYGADDPDPVEWALRIIALACLGAIGSAASAARQYPRLGHLELSRARWLCARLGGDSVTPLPESEEATRASLHVLPARESHEWLQDVCLMLQACKQRESAEALRRIAPDSNADKARRKTTREALRQLLGELAVKTIECDNYIQRTRARWLACGARKAAAALYHRTCRQVGRWLRASGDLVSTEALAEITKLFAGQGHQAVMIIGARRGSAPTLAALAAMEASAGTARVICVHDGLTSWHAAQSDDSRVRWLPWGSHAVQDDGLLSVMREWKVDAFDAALVVADELETQAGAADPLLKIVRRARTLFIVGSRGRLGFLLQLALLRGGFRLHASGEAAGGYAVLRCDNNDRGNEAAVPLACVRDGSIPLDFAGSPRDTGPLPSAG